MNERASEREKTMTAQGVEKSAPSALSDGSWRWLVAGAIAAVFAVLHIQQSLLHGTLALPTTYDDVSYFAEGAIFLDTFHRSGFAGLFDLLGGHIPTSPLSVGLALIGFSVLGVKAWAGPVANAVVLFFFIRAFLGAAKSVPLGQGVLLAAALLAAPFFGLTVMQSRPDMICSLVIAAGTLFILLKEGWISERRDQIIAGALLGAALWCKPHIFPLTLGLFGAAMLLVTIGALLKRNFVLTLKAILVTVGVGVLMALPYYAFALSDTLNYIWTIAFGAEAHIWVSSMPLKDHLLYYLTMPYGQQSIGGWLYIGPVLGVAALYAAFVSWDKRLLAQSLLVAVMVLIAYLAVTIPEFKGPHGYPFAALFLAASGLASIALAKKLGRGPGWVFCSLLLAASLWQFTWQFQASHNGATVDAVYAKSRWAILDAVVNFIGYDAASLTVYQAVPANYLNEANIRFEYQKRGEVPPKFASLLTDDLEAHKRLIAASDIAFVPMPDFPDVIPNLPAANPEFRLKIIQAIGASGRFGVPFPIADPRGGGAILIYRANAQPPGKPR